MVAKPLASAPLNSAVASERRSGGHRRFLGWVGLLTPT
jgi:hypothetical protein